MSSSKSHRTIAARNKNGDHVVAHVSYSGPLPSASELERYNAISPGFAQSIVSMAVDQAVHRRSLEQAAITADIKHSGQAMWAGTIVVVAALLVSAYMASVGCQVSAGIVGGATVVSLAGVYLAGSKSRKSERKAKAEAVPVDPNKR